MVLGQILKIGTVIFRHRKTIYAVLTAQDRYISKSFKYGGYGKATSYGVRSGALIGGIAGAFLKQGDNNVNDGFQTTQPVKRAKTNKSYKTRTGYSIRSRSRSTKSCPPRYYNRRSFSR